MLGAGVMPVSPLSPEEVARGSEQARELRWRLREELERQRELRERRERCEARQSQLQDTL